MNTTFCLFSSLLLFISCLFLTCTLARARSRLHAGKLDKLNPSEKILVWVGKVGHEIQHVERTVMIDDAGHAGEDDNAEDAPASVGHLHESERNCPLGTSPWTPLARVILLEAMHQCDIYWVKAHQCCLCITLISEHNHDNHNKHLARGPPRPPPGRGASPPGT